MNQNPAIAAVIFALITLAFGSPAFAQTAQAAVAEAAWWSELANQAITAAVGLITLGVATLSPFLFNWVKSRSKLAAVLLSQSMFDKLIAGINAQIRAEAEKLRQRLEPVSPKAEATAAALPITIEAKREIVAAAQPKIEAAFKETLKHFDKKPGSQAVTDMILGRVDDALAKPPAVPPVLAK